MKKLTYIVLAFWVLTFTSCYKDPIHANKSGEASITIVNAVPDLSAAYIKFTNGTIIYDTDQAYIPYESSMEFGQSAGDLPVTIVSADDTLHSLYTGNINQKSRGIYSLYLFGQTSSLQTMLVEEQQIPFHPDSVSAVRFVNLSTDNQPFSVTLRGNPADQTEFANVGFKQVAAFKNYAATSEALAQGGYRFSVLDNTGNVVASFFWRRIKPFKNYTLVITGSVTDGSLAVFQVNNF